MSNNTGKRSYKKGGDIGIDNYIYETSYGNIIDIDTIDLLSLLRQYGKESIINSIIKMVQQDKIDYPYALNCSPSVKYMFNNAVNLKLCTTDKKWLQRGYYSPLYPNTYNGDNYLSIVLHSSYYTKIDLITDIYSEKERVKCIVDGNPLPPIDIWKQDNVLKMILSECIDKYESISTYSIRESIYHTGLIKYCNLYKVSIVKQIIMIFSAKKVLDLSCGWGDRLIGSMAANVECYHGCDPNVNMSPIYKEMIRDLNISTDVKIDTVKAEDYTVKESYYDLFHSSPPFWIKEVYPDIDITVSLDDWKVNFLYVYIKKAVYGVKVGGYITIYISDYGRIRYCDDMNKYLSSLGICKYIGCIGLANSSSTTPVTSTISVDNSSNKEHTIDRQYGIWVWQKIFEH